MDMKQCAYGHFYDADKHSSCPYCKDSPYTPNKSSSSVGPTEPTEDSTEGKTRPIWADSDIADTPVVGWLVCVKGSSIGKCYMLHNENNFVGRHESMDVNIQGDMGISHDKPLIISYDSRTRSFYAINNGGRSILRLNGTPLFGTAKLSPWDTLELSETTLMFVPLSCEKFDWDWEKIKRNNGKL